MLGVQNRKTDEDKKLFDQPREMAPVGELIVHTARKPKSNTPAEDVRVAFTYKEMTIRRPARRTEERLPEAITVTGMHIREISDPGDRRARLEWFLLANKTVRSVEDVIRMIRNYQHRWKIERFHYVLGSEQKVLVPGRRT